MKTIVRKPRSLIASILVLLLVFTSIPFTPFKGFQTAKAATNLTITSPIATLYGQHAIVSFHYDDKPHDTEINIIKPVKQFIKSGHFEEGEVHEIKWDGEISRKPAPDGVYTIEVAPTDEDAKYKSEGQVVVSNPAPPAPKYIRAVPNIESTSHVIRGIAERNTKVTLTINYTDGPPDVIKDINVSNSLTWSKKDPKIDLNDYFDAQHFVNNDNKQEKYIGEWEAKVTLKPYKIASITATSTREITGFAKKVSQPSKMYKVLRFYVPDSEQKWAVVASHFYNVIEKEAIEERLGIIAPFNGYPKDTCTDGEVCYGKMHEGKNILLEEPLNEGIISKEEAEKLEEEYANKNGHPLALDFDPINLSTGDFSFFHTNMSLEAKMPIEFGVAYHSRDKFNGDIGVGWHHTFEGHLVELEDGNVYVKTPEGASLKYLSSGGGNFVTPPGVYDTLKKNSNGTFTLETPEKTQYIYREDGTLHKIIDANKNVTTLKYYGSLLQKVETNGASLSFTYGKAGKIDQVIDHSGRTVTYDYDEKTHDLISITLPDNATIGFQYDENHQITEISNPNKTLSLINQYDDEGRVIKQRDFSGAWGEIQYFPEENKTITIDARKNKTTYKYDERHRQTDIIFPDGSSNHFEYDGNDNVTKFIDGNKNETNYVYDNKGNVLQEIDPLGNITTFAYNSLNKPTKMIDPEGNTSEFEYDNAGNMTAVINPLKERMDIVYEQGVPTSIENPNGDIIELVNDQFGFAKTVKDPLGNPVQLVRDSLHRVETITDALGYVTEIQYDDRSRIEARINPLKQLEKFQYDKDSNLTQYTDVSGATTTYTYDSYERVSSMKDAKGNITKYEYDEVGNLRKEILPNGATIEYIYDNMNRVREVIDGEKHVTQYDYDDNGNVKKVIEPEGGETTITYDENNRPITVTDALSATTTYTYDKVGNLTHETDALKNTTSYEYDALGRVIKATNALGDETTYEYDKLGNIVKTVQPNGAVWTMNYDKRGMLTSVVNPLGYTKTYNRDELGRVVNLVDEKENITTYDYDPLHRIREITNPLGHKSSFTYHPLGMVENIIDEKGQTTTYTYDVLGQLETVRNALGQTTSYQYDAVGNIKQKKNAKGNITTYGYDLNNQLLTELNPLNQATALTYDGNGNVDTVSYPNGSTVDFNYDVLNQVKTIKYSDGKSVAYDYDALGRRTSMRDTQGQTTYQYDALNRITNVTDAYSRTVKYEWTKDNQRSKITYPDGATAQYSYDLLGQLTEVTDVDGHVTKYEYDPTGLMTKKYLPTGAISDYAYDKLGQITSLTHKNQYGQVLEQMSYEYDPTGNITKMLRKEDADEDDYDETVITNYAYDAINQLIEVQKQNGHGSTSLLKTSYSYDAVGNRLNKVMAWGDMSTTENYTYDIADKLTEWTDGSETKNYSYDLSGNLLEIATKIIPNVTESITQPILEPAAPPETVTELVYEMDEIMDPVIESDPEESILPAGIMEEDSESDDKDGNEQFTWDAANRLIKHINPKGDITQYAYDGDGNRVKMTIDYKHGPKGNNGNGNNNNGNNGNGNNGNGNGNNGNGNGNANCHQVPPGFIPPGLAKKCGYGEEPFPDNRKGGPRDGWEQQHKKKHWEFYYTNDVTLELPEALQVTEADPTKWKETYVYGAGGERLSMTFLPANDDNDGWEPVPGTGGAEPGAIPKTLYYLTDHLGSTIGLLEKDGRMSAEYHYDEFGIPLDQKKFDVNWPGPDNLYGYTGLGYDYSSGLTYARARYYQPEVGRFISADPYKGDMWNPQSQNQYGYVHNNPLMYVDPSGHRAKLVKAAASVAVEAGKAVGKFVSKVYKKNKEYFNKGKGKTVDDILKDATPGRATKGKATQYEKSGGFNQAMDDFYNMGVTNVREIPNGRVGTLPDGRTVNVRNNSSDGRPTLEIFDGKNSIKIRYGE